MQAELKEEWMVSLPVDLTTQPDILIPDARPLIHLAQADALHLLHEIGRAVVLVDVVADEVTRNPAKPGAQALGRWIEDGKRPGSDAPVRVEETDTGRAVALARVADPTFSMRNGGENAIVGWLVETVQGTDVATIVVCENGRVPNVSAAQALGADIDVVTTRTFLDLAERRGLIVSALEVWRIVEARSPTANPRIQALSQRRIGTGKQDDT